ncbi:hypothetical protein CRYUN_Cryun04dG0023400 [Craigia yunnanensis]
MSGTKVDSKAKSSWSLVSNLMHQKRTASEQKEADTNEVTKVDAALELLDGQIASKCENSTALIGNVQIEMQELNSSIQDLEERLEFLFRDLIKARPSFSTSSISRKS